ncbi:hypothetical protein Tco_0782391, partial [Tanacetum coccineum]
IKDSGILDTNSSALNDFLVLSLVEQMTDHVANLDMENQTNKMVKHSNYNPDTSVKSHTPVRIEAPSELPKDMVIRKLKDMIKSLSGKDSVENVRKDIDEVEMININIENKLRKLKEKNVVDTAISEPIITIAPRMFKLDIEPISHRLKNNKDAHEKSVVVTPMNKDKKVRFVELVTSSSNFPKQTDSLRTKYSNKPLLNSTGVNTLTSASRSKPSGSKTKFGVALKDYLI